MSDSSMGLPSPVDAAIAEWYEAIEKGAAPDREAFLSRYQHVRGDLERFLSDFDRFTPPREAGRGEFSCGDGSSKPSSVDSPTQLDRRNEDAGERLQPETIRYFGDFQLNREIARGGMGVVYEARQLSLNRPVALKMILSGRLASPEEVARFHREAQAVAQLEHPGIVPIYEVGQHADQHYFAMAYVPGPSLAARLLESPLEPRVAAALVRECALAIQTAHDRGIVHRDLKPSNILLAPLREPAAGQFPFRPRITDFGLAKLGTSDSSMTQSGRILGTPSYMPPEQAAGHLRQVGPAADIYALGAVLYACVAGRPPFQAASAVDTVRQVIEQDPVSLRQLNTTVPPDLETICLKALEKSIPRRYLSAREFADDLERFLENRPIRARAVTRRERFVRWCRRNPIVAGLSAGVLLSLVAGIVVSGYFAWRERQRAIQETAAKADAVTQTQIATTALREQERLTSVAQAAEQAEFKQRIAAVDAEKRATQAAEAERKSAEGLRHSLYLSDLTRLPELAQRHQTAAIEQILRRHIPATGQSDRRGFDWYYWWNQIHASDAIVTCPGPVDQLALAPDGRQLAIACRDQAHIVDLESWTLLAGKFRIGDSGLASLQYGRDGATLLASNHLGVPYAWDVAGGRMLATGLPLTLSKTQIDNANLYVPRWPSAFSPDGRYFVGPDILLELLSVWDIRQQLHRQLREPSDGVYMTNRRGDGQLYASRDLFFENPNGSGWRRSNSFGQTLTSDPRSGDEYLGTPTFGLRFSPDGKWLACGNRGGQIFVYNLAEQTITHRLTLGAGIIWDLAISDDNQWLAAASDEGQAATWQLSTGEPGPTYRSHVGAVRSIRFAAGGDLVISAGADRDLHVWRRSGAVPVTRLLGHSDTVTALAVSADGRNLWSGSRDRTVRRWPLTRPATRFENDVEADLVGLSSSNDGSTVASLGTLYTDTNPYYPVWEGTTGRLRGSIPLEDTGSWAPQGLVVSPDGRFIVVSYRGDLRVIDAKSLAEVSRSALKVQSQRRPPPSGKPDYESLGADYGFTPDGRTLFVIARSGESEIRNVTTGEVLRRFESPLVAPRLQVSFSPDGQRLFCVSDRTIVSCRWPDLGDSKRVDVDAPENGLLRCLRSSPTGRYACALTYVSKAQPPQSSAYLIDFDQPESARPIAAATAGSVIHDAFFPRGSDCLITVESKLASVRQIPTGNLIRSAELPLGMVGVIGCTGIGRGESDDHVLMPARAGGVVQWNWRENRLGSSFEAMRRSLDDFSWSADGERLIGYWRHRRPYVESLDSIIARAWELDGGRATSLGSITNLKLGGHARAPWDLFPEEFGVKFDVATLRDLARVDDRVWIPEGKPLRVTAVRISSDGVFAATIHDTTRIAIWKRAALDRPTRYQAVKILTIPAIALAWSPGKEYLCAVGLNDGLVLLDRKGEIRFRAERSGGVHSVNWSIDATTIATSTASGEIDLWDSGRGVIDRSFKALVGRAADVLLPDDGVTLIAAGDDGQVLVLDRETGSLRLKLGEHRGGIGGLALSPDGRMLASCGRDGVIQIWHAPHAARKVGDRSLELPSDDAPFSPPEINLAGWSDVTSRLELPETRTLQAAEQREVDFATRLVELKVPFSYRLSFNNAQRKFDFVDAAPKAASALPERGFSVDEVPLPEAIRREGRAKYQAVMSSLKTADFTRLAGLRAIDACGATWSREDVATFRDMPKLESLDLSDIKLDEIPASTFQGMNGLRTLSLAGTQANDSVFARVSGLPALKRLDLCATVITDGGLSTLAEIPELQELDLGQTAISDQGLAGLGQLPNLKRIDVLGSRIGLEGYLSVLPRWPDLEVVRIPGEWHASAPELLEALRATVAVDGNSGTRLESIRRIQQGGRVTAWTGTAAQLSESDFAVLQRLPHIREIVVPDPIRQVSLVPLAAAAERLDSLSLTGDTLTDLSVAPLSQLKHLKRLHLYGSQLTPAGLRVLRGLPLVALRIERCKSITMSAIVECFPQLRELSVNGCYLADGDVAQVSRLEQLEVLDFDSNATARLSTAAALRLPRLRWIEGRVDDKRLSRLKVDGEMPRVDLSSEQERRP